MNYEKIYFLIYKNNNKKTEKIEERNKEKNKFMSKNAMEKS